MTVPLLLVLLCCALARGTGEDEGAAGQLGADRVVHATRGETASFTVGPFQVYCEWVCLGTESNGNRKDVIYSDGRICPDEVYNQYRDRVEPSCNGSFVLKNILFEDAGFYQLECDGKVANSYYLHVVDPVCNVSIERIPSVNGILLSCNVTGSGASVAWTRDGKSVPESHILTDNHRLSVARGIACGSYQCGVQCGVLGPQYDTINLTSPDYSALICCPLMTEILAVGGVYAGAFLVQAILYILRMLTKPKDVCGDDAETRRNPVNSQVKQRAVFSTAVQIALKFWHEVIAFISSMCFLDQLFPRDWKSIDLTPIGLLLFITLGVDVLLCIIKRISFFKVKVRQKKALRCICCVLPWAIAVLQHFCIIIGAAYFLKDCMNMRCMEVSSMSWAWAVPIVVVPLLVLLIGAFMYQLYSVNKLKQPSVKLEMNEVDSKWPCLEKAASPTELGDQGREIRK